MYECMCWVGAGPADLGPLPEWRELWDVCTDGPTGTTLPRPGCEKLRLAVVEDRQALGRRVIGHPRAQEPHLHPRETTDGCKGPWC